MGLKSSERRWQIAEVLRHARHSTPLLVLGDFNEHWPGALRLSDGAFGQSPLHEDRLGSLAGADERRVTEVLMIDHTGVNVSDPMKSRKFYDAALAPLGYKVLAEIPKEHSGGMVVLGYGVAPKPDFWMAEGKPQHPHIHIAFRAENKAAVDAFYKAAMAAGGRDNGPPGPRPHYHANYYGAFVLDPDGHNIEAVFHG